MIHAAACRKLGGQNVHFAQHHDLVETCRAHPGAILLCLDGQNIPHALISAARRYAGAVVLWQFDDPYNLASNVETSIVFDHVFTNEPRAVTAYDGQASFLPLAGEAWDGKIPGEDDKEFDVFFCGTAWPNRVVTLNRLLTALPDLKWRIVLAYNEHLPRLPLRLPESAYVQRLEFGDLLETAARSRITLDLNRIFPGGDRSEIAQSATFPGPRVFELAGRGAFQLTVNTPGLREVFDTSEIPSIGDRPAQIHEALKGWLDAPEKRAAAAARARDKIAQAHTYDHRLSQILDVSQDLVARKGTTAPRAERKRRILFVVHNILNEGNFGGLELHQDTVAKYIARECEVFFFWSYRVSGGRQIVLLDNDYNELQSHRMADIDTSMLLQDKTFEQVFSNVLHEHDIDLVHFFHFREVPPSLGAIARALGTPYTVSLHDYYPISRNFTLTNENGAFNEARLSRLNELEHNASQLFKGDPGSYTRRHAAYDRVLKRAATVIQISRASRCIFEKVFPALTSHPSVRIHHAPLPSDNFKIYRQVAKPRSLRPTPRYVVLGNMAAHKGGPYLIDALRRLKVFEGEIHFHGSMDANIRQRIEKAIGEKAVFHGRYQPGSLDLTEYDFSLHLSTWPETYCQTLSEAWAMGVIPIVTDLGALGERVTHMKTGLKVAPMFPGALAQLFDTIPQGLERYEHMRHIDTEELFMDRDTAARQYYEAFEEILDTLPPPVDTVKLQGAQANVTSEVIGIEAHDDKWTSSGRDRSTELVRPLPAETSFLRLEPAQVVRPAKPGDIYANGSLDKVELVLDPNAGVQSRHLLSDGADVYFDDILRVTGWCKFDELPVTARAVVLVAPEGADAWTSFDAEQEFRKDVAEYFGKHAAGEWGVFADVRLPNPEQLNYGCLHVCIGLRLDDGKIVTHPKRLYLNGHLGRRPAGDPC